MASLAATGCSSLWAWKSKNCSPLFPRPGCADRSSTQPPTFNRSFLMQRRTFISSAAIASLAGPSLVRAQSALNVAFMLPMSGPTGLFGPSAKACAELAFENINSRGGILGQKINPLYADSGLPPAEVTQGALKLWKGQKAQAVIGMH